MPIYEFTCKQCKTPFEELVQSKSETIACPNCGSENVEKMLSVFGVQAEQSLPCADGSCSMPGAMPACGQGACPSCMD